jgi:hypothetical protein
VWAIWLALIALLVVGMGNLWETPGVFPRARSPDLTPTPTLVVVEICINKTRTVRVYRSILHESFMVGMESCNKYMLV